MSPVSDLLYSDTEEALRDSVRHLFGDRCPPETVAQAYDPVPQDFSGVWRRLAGELGVAGLLVPESLGGAGAGAREVAVVMEKIGRAVAPVPFLSSAVLATVALLGAGEADVLVVPVTGPDGLELHTVLRAAPGVEVSPLLALDMTRPLATVRFSGAASSRVGPADGAVAEALETGAALLASEQLGVARWCFDTTLAYAKQRKQFGRAIGSYQAIKHRLADLWFEVSSATAVARYAADTCARGDEDAATATAIAQAYCSGVAVHAAEECVQLHGGIGMTWEYPAHLYLKRAKSDQLALGTAYRHRARLAQLVGLAVS